MLEAESCPQSIVSPCGGDEDSGEEELAVLPRHTKVIVTGNNRTKSVLVGLHGVVKKAVGLGGWHWLVLTNGLEVKLQRNALSVLEHPTGLEEDEDDSEDLVSCRTNVEDFGKPFKQRGRLQKPSVSSKPGTRSQMVDASSKGLKSSPSGLLRVDFSKLEMAALLRYWRHFNLVDLGPNPSKEQLVDAVERHFMSQDHLACCFCTRNCCTKEVWPRKYLSCLDWEFSVCCNSCAGQLDEVQVINAFVQAAKRLKTVYG